MELILTGRIPSKKNSTLVMCRGNRAIHIPSNAYRAWHKAASEQLNFFKIKLCMSKVEKITLLFYAPDKRHSDLTNKAESVMDLLKDNQVILDDSWYVVPNINLVFAGVDKENPRVIILIV